MTLQQVERAHIERVLEQTQWRVEGTGGAAELLGLKPSTLRSRLAKLNIRRGNRTTTNRE
jgi:transcriptional regulator with GAF, ATPase, and Fis domain